jgi:radical SAM superfamily enzyme YgiQ (UPF0313 family)
MQILLIKCHGKSLLSRVRPIVTEPLELEMIAAVLNRFSGEGLRYRIFDPWLEGGSSEGVIEKEKPDVLMLTGYVTAVEEIKALAAFAERVSPASAVWVGGVHAEGCPEDFYSEGIDAVFFAHALWGLDFLLKTHFEQDAEFSSLYEKTPGVACKADGARWVAKGPSAEGWAFEGPLPDRSYFEVHKRSIRYMERRGVALLKTARACPHLCEFCYCRLLNGGVYQERPLEEVIEEIRGVSAGTIWIVDDCFLTTAARAAAWIKALESLAAEGVHKRFIAYARADVAVRLQDYVKRLGALGFEEWIVGLEAVEDAQLRALGKGVEADDNARAVEMFRTAGARLTALFLVSPDDSAGDFRRLAAWIKKHGVRRFTVSILTPLKGTVVYEQYAARMAAEGLERPERFDFLHLVMRPTRMPAWLFYLRFWRLSLKARLR